DLLDQQRALVGKRGPRQEPNHRKRHRELSHVFTSLLKRFHDQQRSGPPEGSPSAGAVAAGWKKSWMRCASLGVTFGTAASSATDACRTTFADPSVLSKLVRTVGPTPGIWSSTDEMVRRWRSFL